jgi:arylsulfatase
MLRPLAYAAQGALAALAAAALWAAIDALGLCTRIEALTPGRLTAFALLVSAALALPIGALAGVGAALGGGGPGAARAAGGGIAFATWGLAVLGVAVNRSLLPSRWHPMSVAANCVLVLLLVALGWWVARWLRRPAGGRLVWASLVVTALAAVVLPSFLGPSPRPGPRPPVSASGGAADRPSVLFVVIDSLRADESRSSDLGPALRAVGDAGVSFTRAYAQSSWTKPSVATLFTGLHPLTHGAVGRGDVLGRDFTTLPETLSGLGYRTAVFSSNPWVSPAFGFGQGVDHFYESDPGGDPTRLLAVARTLQLVARAAPAADAGRGLRALRLLLGLDRPDRTNCERDEEITAAAADWLRTADAPFFGYVHYMCVHSPYEPPGPRPVSRARQLAAQHGEVSLSAEEQAALRAQYGAAARHADMLLGRLLAALDEDAAARTIVVVTADHGEEFGEHGQYGHGKNLYREVVEVPLHVRFPGRIPPRSRVGVPVGGVDLFQLLLGLLAVPGVDGRDGRRLLDGEQRVRPPIHLSLDLEGGFSVASLVAGDYQYIETTPHRSATPRRELYHLARDPAERTNLWDAGSPEGLALADTLRDLDRTTPRGVAQKVVVSADTDRRLRALGYVQ